MAKSPPPQEMAASKIRSSCAGSTSIYKRPQDIGDHPASLCQEHCEQSPDDFLLSSQSLSDRCQLRCDCNAILCLLAHVLLSLDDHSLSHGHGGFAGSHIALQQSIHRHAACEILGDLDLETIESINSAMQSLKDITPQEKAATMIEFGDFFYKDKPLSTKLKEPAKKQAPVKKAPAKKQAKKTTVDVCNKAKGVELDRSIKLPQIPDANEKLMEAIISGFGSRNLPKTNKYLSRIKEEYELISKKEFSSYFLIQKMMTDEARRVCPKLLGWGDGSEAVGAGRGSAVGSLICYCLYITDVDPVHHDLLFSRFMSEARGGKSMKLRFSKVG